MKTWPEVGAMRPSMILMKVVLPQPEGPTMQANSSWRISRSRSRKTVMSARFRPTYDLDNLRIETLGWLILGSLKASGNNRYLIVCQSDATEPCETDVVSAPAIW